MRKITGCLTHVHEKGYTPFTYHMDKNGQRHQHYKATFFLSYCVAVVLLVTTSRYWIPSLRFEDWDYRDHQILAGIGLMGMAMVAGLIAGTIHFEINRCRKVKDRSDYSVQIAEDAEIPMKELHTPINEATGLMGQDREGASVYRIENCHPLRMIYPATPIKTGLWIPMVGLFIFAVAILIRPDLFNEFAGNSPVSNTTRFTNCTLRNDTLITNATVCVSLLGHFMGSLTLILGGILGDLAVSMGIGTLFHYAGAKATERCSQDQSVIPVIS